MDETSIIIISGLIAITNFICVITIAINVNKIKDVECKPFQNKRPDYPLKVIELLQNILSAQQQKNDAIKKLKSELEASHNNGVKPGMKSKELIQLEEITGLQKQQITLLTKIVDTSTGEEKKKLLEKWKKATEIINSYEEN